ncbi:hypothetical protein NQZ68_021796 [Dissostichus eleginoides]|nr:hypothetical protein NQZ68_021796 [Dissostichus eleginoides]
MANQLDLLVDQKLAALLVSLQEEQIYLRHVCEDVMRRMDLHVAQDVMRRMDLHVAQDVMRRMRRMDLHVSQDVMK